MKDARRHGGGSLSVTSVLQRDAEALVGSAEMVVNPTELKMTGEGKRRVGNRPRATRERGNEFAEGEVEAFDESSLDKARETEGLERGAISIPRTTTNDGLEELEAIPGLDLEELSEAQAGIDVPTGEALTILRR